MSDNPTNTKAGEWDADDVPDTVVVLWIAALLVVVGAACVAVLAAVKIAVWALASP